MQDIITSFVMVTLTSTTPTFWKVQPIFTKRMKHLDLLITDSEASAIQIQDAMPMENCGKPL